MASVGIREFGRRASELLRRVEQGETIEVTDRGRRVAVLAPAPEGTALDRLRALGEIERAKGDLDDLREPLAPTPGREQPSAALCRLRKNAERW